MFSKINLILLPAVTLSALYVTDLRVGIQRQKVLYGKAQEEEIRLQQDKAQLIYEHSRYSDTKLVSQAAEKMKMHEAKDHQIVEIRY